MPPIRAIHHLSLSVTDLGASVAWYTRVLGFEITAEVEQPTFSRTRMHQRDSAVTLTVTRHQEGSGDRFDERRTGLDHLAFLVGGIDDLGAWRAHLDDCGAAHSGIVHHSPTVARITVRDPDNVQLELMGIED